MKIDYYNIETRLLSLKESGYFKSTIKLGAGHYRLNNILDIYPRHQKWHSLSTGKRGMYYDLEDFVIGFFNPELRGKNQLPFTPKVYY